jgi:cbb3-type cytochrome oxidase maturation protein
MSVIIILIIASVLVALGFLTAFLWSVKSGQYDDDYTPSIRILFDDEIKSDKTNQNNTQIKSVN